MISPEGAASRIFLNFVPSPSDPSLEANASGAEESDRVSKRPLPSRKMNPRLYRVIVTFGIAALIAVPFAIFFLGGASASGGQVLAYREGKLPSDQQYGQDERFLCEFLGANGFQKLSPDAIAIRIQRRAPAGYTLAAAFEYPIPLSRPVAIAIFRDPQRSGFWIGKEASHPTWAVPFAKAAFKKLGPPLVSAWTEHLSAANP